jgi:hypothetical protein
MQKMQKKNENNNSIISFRTMSYKEFFDTDTFQDDKLLVLNKNDPSAVLATIPMHRVLWAANSSYFRVYLKNWTSHEVKFSIDENDKEALDTVVKSFYMILPEEDLSLKQWFSVFSICDQLGVENTIKERGVAFLKEKTTLTDISEFYNSRPEIRIVKELSDHFQKSVLSNFKYLMHIYESKIERFVALPYWAVIEILRDDTVTVKDSENLLLVLCMAWVHGEEGKRASKEQLKEMCSYIRLSRLSTVFFMDVLPKLEWFDLSNENYNKVQKFRAMDTFIRYEAFGPGCIFDSVDFSEHWYAPDRSNVNSVDMDCLVIGICIPEEHFFSWVEGWKLTLESKTMDFYWKGCFWNVSLSFDRTGSVFLTTECNVRYGDGTLVPLDHLFTGSLTQRLNHRSNFCHRTFTRTEVLHGDMRNKNLFEYIMSTFRFQNKKLHFNFKIHFIM